MRALVVEEERWFERLAWLVDVASLCLVESVQKDPTRWKGVAVASVEMADWAPRAESPTKRMTENLVVEASPGAAEPVEIVASKTCSAWNDFACSMTTMREPVAAAWNVKTKAQAAAL